MNERAAFDTVLGLGLLLPTPRVGLGVANTTYLGEAVIRDK